MSRFVSFAVATAVLALSATATAAQIYPLNNGPNGTGSNAVDSEKGFDGINAVAPEREFLYHPDRAGSAAAGLDAAAIPTGGISAGEGAVPVGRHARHPRRHASLR